MKILKYKVAGAIYEAETGPEAQVGDQVKLFLDTDANPSFPEYVFGIIQPGIKKNCEGFTTYSIEYTLDVYTLHQDDVVSVETTAAVDVVAADLAAEVTRAEAAEAAETAARIAADALKAPLASPAFTGNPTAPTATTTDNDTSIATTAFVQAQPVVRYTAQSLTGPQKTQTQTNIGTINIDFANTILYDGDGAEAFDWTNRVFYSGAGTPLFGWYAPGILSFEEAVNFRFGTTTGTNIATSVSEKLAFHGATPVIQRSGAAQVAVTTTSSTNVTPYGFSTQAQADAIVVLLNEIRAALVQKGLIKGAS